jgi:hypothetical protein
MENQIYAAARERLAALDVEREELLIFIRTYERLALSGQSPNLRQSLAVSKPAQSPKWTTAQIVHTAMEVLSDNGRPMKLADLYDEVIARGAHIGGKNPRNNLGAMLSADRVRLTTGPQGWYFKDEYPPQLEEPGYDEGPADDAGPSLSNGAADTTPWLGH